MGFTVIWTKSYYIYRSYFFVTGIIGAVDHITLQQGMKTLPVF